MIGFQSLISLGWRFDLEGKLESFPYGNEAIAELRAIVEVGLFRGYVPNRE